MTKSVNLPEDMTIIHTCVSNIRAPKYLKELLTELNGEIDSSIIIVGDINTPHSIIDRKIRLKINKESRELEMHINKFDQTDIYIIFQPTTVESTIIIQDYYYPG